MSSGRKGSSMAGRPVRGFEIHIAVSDTDITMRMADEDEPEQAIYKKYRILSIAEDPLRREYIGKMYVKLTDAIVDLRKFISERMEHYESQPSEDEDMTGQGPTDIQGVSDREAVEQAVIHLKGKFPQDEGRRLLMLESVREGLTLMQHDPARYLVQPERLPGMIRAAELLLSEEQDRIAGRN